MSIQDEVEELRGTAERSFDGMKASAMFLSILDPEQYKRDPVALIGLSLAILMDKPLYFVVREGQILPESIKRLAKGIEYCKDGDTRGQIEAVERIVAKARAH